MRPSSATISAVLLTLGAGLLTWLLYDATSVRETLGLGSLASEGTVALVGLVISAAALGAGLAFWRKGRGRFAG